MPGELQSLKSLKREMGRNICRLLAAAAILSVLPVGAAANDSVGHLAAGGLVLGRTDAIEMRSEDLFVSTSEIRVRYEFHNRTERDVTTIVAFPLPEVSAPSDANNFVIPESHDPANFLAFETRVQGKPAKMEVEQRAVAVGIDRTEMLKSVGLDVSPLARGISDKLAGLPKSTLEKLRSAAMIEYDIYDVGQGMQRHIKSTWAVRTTYYWTQTFPANQSLVIEHSYKPSVGGSAQTFVGSDYANAEVLREYTDRYCMTPGFIRAARTKQRKGSNSNSVALSEQRLEYVLTTGANWLGWVGAFRLTVDKGAPGNLVSFCMDGVKKVSPTRFEVNKKDFNPTRNLEVLILKPLAIR